MPDYILREAALKEMLDKSSKHGFELQQQGKHMTRNEGEMFRRDYDVIKSLPAADVVQVVQCKDCKHWTHDHDAGRWCWCRSLDIGTAPDFYCKDGCRMDGGERHD